MKKLIILAAVLMAFLLIYGCGKSSEQHAIVAKEKISQAAEELKEAVVDANAEAKENATKEWQKFKMASENEITAIENQTKELEYKISKAGKKEKLKLRIQLDNGKQKLNEQKQKLIKRNSEFQTDIKRFDESVAEKNESFKREFKHDMEKVGATLKDLFKDNVK